MCNERMASSKNLISPAEPTPEEVVTLALNEQGFLFQQKVLELVDDSPYCGWFSTAIEYPVSFGLPGTFDTRIDMVLQRRTSTHDPWNLVVECKRANRDYKRWVFFDQAIRLKGITKKSLFYHRADLAGSWSDNGQDLPPLVQRVERIPSHQDCPIFNFYVETRLNRPTSGQQRASATEAIEDALRQVCTGLIGLARDLHRMKKLNFRLLPVVVTTGDLMSADFESTDISTERGQIDASKLKLTPREWLGVNYRIDESVSRFAGLTTNIGTSIGESIWTRYVRTVFVVRSERFADFLKWVNHWIVD